MTDQVCKSNTHLIWAPAIPIALAVLAVAKIGVHLVFFLHLTCRRIDVSKSSALHLHDVIHRRHHALVEMAHDPDRTGR